MKSYELEAKDINEHHINTYYWCAKRFWRSNNAKSKERAKGAELKELYSPDEVPFKTHTYKHAEALRSQNEVLKFFLDWHGKKLQPTKIHQAPQTQKGNLFSTNDLAMIKNYLLDKLAKHIHDAHYSSGAIIPKEYLKFDD